MGWLHFIIGSIAAGFPSAAEGYEDEPLNLHDWLVQHPAATFFYRVRGNALFAEGISDGAVLVVDRSIHPVPPLAGPDRHRRRGRRRSTAALPVRTDDGYPRQRLRQQHP
ncbi:MAG: S24 family peptidase [Phycisphaeraceae bacterium]